MVRQAYLQSKAWYAIDSLVRHHGNYLLVDFHWMHLSNQCYFLSYRNRLLNRVGKKNNNKKSTKILVPNIPHIDRMNKNEVEVHEPFKKSLECSFK